MKRVLRLMVAFIMLGTTFSLSVSAKAAVLGYELENGIDVIYTWNHSTAVENKLYEINFAKNNWEYPGWYNPIDFVNSSTNDSTNIDFWAYPSEYFSRNVLGYTKFYQTGYIQVDPVLQDWYWCKIAINIDDPGNYNEERGTVVHEIGHGLGLAHNTNVNSIMCQRGSGRIVNTVQYKDNTDVLHLYGY
ncbi:MAG: matrixin family metalloprotease [Clostridiaceae bacterium]